MTWVPDSWSYTRPGDRLLDTFRDDRGRLHIKGIGVTTQNLHRAGLRHLSDAFLSGDTVELLARVVQRQLPLGTVIERVYRAPTQDGVVCYALHYSFFPVEEGHAFPVDWLTTPLPKDAFTEMYDWEYLARGL